MIVCGSLVINIPHNNATDDDTPDVPALPLVEVKSGMEDKMLSD